MPLTSSRLAVISVLLFAALFPARGASVPPVPPVFLTGTGGPYPDYTQQSFKTLPVGKTLVVPIVVSGSGPISYSASSSSSALVPIIKTGYPVMNIQVSYSGTTTVSGSVNTLYSFTGGNDGGNPQAGVIQASNGDLYGTTLADGTNGFGTVYEIGTSSSTIDTLYSFTGGTDGGRPYAPLYQTSSGNFYGTTGTGGTNGAGTVYQITTTGSLTTLYSFTGAADGGNPQAGVVTMGTGGILYGTTTTGGAGGGTIFQIDTSGTIPVFNTLYPFTSGSDGGNPQGTLFSSSDGNLYGATADGGAYGSGTSGFGTIFKIPATGGSLTTLYSFTGGNDGAHPYGGVIQTADGAIYGTTVSSGTYGYGTVFELTTRGTLIPLHSFTGGSDGGYPYGGLISATDGKLYGTTESSGTNIKGTIFQVTVSGGLQFQTLYTFTGGANGANPYSGVIQGSDGNFYGTTYTSGSGGAGTIYQLPAKFTPSFSGTMSFALLRDMAPTTCGYIAGFAQAGYYTNCQFFRIADLSSSSLPGFIAQGGDPTNTGTGNPGFAFDDELNPSLIFTGAGQLAMANSGVNTTTYHGTNGSQFFITDYNQDTLRSLDFGYTIFGQLLTGFDTMQKVMAVTTGTDGQTPTVPVVMNSVTVTEDNTDAIMLVNAAGSVPGGATITVNATDPGGHKAVTPSTTGTTTTTGQAHTIATMDDIVNDPPFILPDDNAYASLNQKVTFPITTRDLEFDYLLSGAFVISGSAGKVSTSGNLAIVTPLASSPIGNVTAGFYVYEPFLSSNGQHFGTAGAGLGTGKLTPLPALFRAVPGPGNFLTSSTGGTPVIGSFLCSNPSATAGDFTATINWGDGSTISGTDAVSVVKSSYLPTTYSITLGTDKVYQNPGIYPVVATVTDTYGNVLQVQNTAVISNSNIYAYGRTFTAAKGAFNGMVATFVDTRNSAPASTYNAVINWGDGVVGTGTIAGSNASFQVYGAHKYAAGTTYPVDVTIISLADPTQFGYAWSIAKLTGVATHQPPFAQSHIVGELGNPGFGAGYLDEEVTLFNSGNIASGPITLQFYLSPTTSLGAGAILLQVGKGTTYNTVSIPAGNAISGAVSDIFVPSGVKSRGKYLIMKVITSDPIGSHMDYPRTFADPNPLIE